MWLVNKGVIKIPAITFCLFGLVFTHTQKSECDELQERLKACKHRGGGRER